MAIKNKDLNDFGAVCVIGSTGSIGQTALRVIKNLGLRVSALVAYGNLPLLKKQSEAFNPDIIGVIDSGKGSDARALFGNKLVLGVDALTVPCTLPQTETVLISVTGHSGIHSLITALTSGKRVALANKESLVAGGELISRMFLGDNFGKSGGLAGSSLNTLESKCDNTEKETKNISEGASGFVCDRLGKACNASNITSENAEDALSNKHNRGGVRAELSGECVQKDCLIAENSSKKSGIIIPVDSEHSAVFQCLKSGRHREIDKIILTASGGAFYTLSKPELDAITPAQIHHPNWSMGRKITLDSCTMMNKALEIIEAYWLFGTDKIDYVVHKESIIHSMVRFVDGGIMAQLAPPDMSLPIQYALTYPLRVGGACGRAIETGGHADNKCKNAESDVQSKNYTDFEFDRPVTFLKKNELFYAPSLALAAIKRGGTAGAVLNAANEAATQLFENGQILFTDIVKITEKCLSMSDIVPINSLCDITSAHNDTMERVKMDYKSLRA